MFFFANICIGQMMRDMDKRYKRPLETVVETCFLLEFPDRYEAERFKPSIMRFGFALFFSYIHG